MMLTFFQKEVQKVKQKVIKEFVSQEPLDRFGWRLRRLLLDSRQLDVGTL